MTIQNTADDLKSTLISRNITVLGKRTSVRLEPEMWRALKDIATREHCTIHEMCSLIAMRKKNNTSLTAAIRVFLMLYYRSASTEEGHIKAGHGNFENMKRRAGFTSNTRFSGMNGSNDQDYNDSEHVNYDSNQANGYSNGQVRSA